VNASLQTELDAQCVEMRKWQDSSVRGESRLSGADLELKRVKTQSQVGFTLNLSSLSDLDRN
jgi:hypothetical protein